MMSLESELKMWVDELAGFRKELRIGLPTADERAGIEEEIERCEYHISELEEML